MKEEKRTIVLLREEFNKGFQKGKLEARKEIEKIIDKNILLNRKAIRTYDNPDHTLKIRLGLVIDELEKLKKEIWGGKE